MGRDDQDRSRRTGRMEKVGFASRKINNELFARFRKACDNFFTAKGDYYHKIKEEMAANLTKKTALCEQAEALKDSTDWHKTADRLVALQKEWKTIGTVAKKHSDAVWHRFQQACDSFFEKRKKALNEGRSEEQANLKAKREIIEQLKAIPADTPRNEAMAKVKGFKPAGSKSAMCLSARKTNYMMTTGLYATLSMPALAMPGAA